MFVETLEAIGTAKKGFDILQALNPYIGKIWRKYRAKGTKVIIFGPGGVGKSTLGEIFTSNKEVIKDSIKGQYNQSDRVENFFSDKSNIPFTLINPPGQPSRAYAWDEIFRDISAGKIKGIIHMVSYGYHAIRELSPAQVGNWYSPGMSQDDFIENYVNYFREKELGSLNVLMPHVKAANIKKPIWMITVVTKQDIWWNQRHEMETYYKNGQYNNLINDIHDQLGRKYFVHEYMSVSLLISRFLQNHPDYTINNTAGYDEYLKFANLQALINRVNDFLEEYS